MAVNEEAPAPPDMFFLPFMAHGHLFPMVDMATMFSTRGVNAAVLVTPVSAAAVQPAVEKAASSGNGQLNLLRLPGPPGWSCSDPMALPEEERSSFFRAAFAAIRHPLQSLLRDRRPACLVFDALFTWAIDDARDAGVPTVLAFNGTCFLAMCAYGAVHRHLPPRDRLAAESVVVPGLPRRIELLRSQLPDPSAPDFLAGITESESRSDGVLMNSFYELEPDFVEHCRTALARRAWHVGPAIFHSQRIAAEFSVYGDWLEEKAARSVVYACFGSWLKLSGSQMDQVTAALEGTNRPYILVVGASGDGGGDTPGENDRITKGIVMRGSAPQAAILRHRAIGAFLTHCGWNSCLEAFAGGVPMITWPLASEQFYNEKLVVEVLGAGVAVGSREWAMEERRRRQVVSAAEIRRAVDAVMGEAAAAAAVRRRAAELAGMSEKAVREGGSSHADAGRLVAEIAARAGPAPTTSTFERVVVEDGKTKQ